MNVQDERDLRDSLTGLLEGVTPHPAPVARAVRQGKGIRMRRWVSAAAAIAVIAAGAAIAPAVLRSQAPGPSGPGHHKVPHFKVRLLPVRADARYGVIISEGVTDGKRWTVTASGSGSREMLQVTGVTGRVPESTSLWQDQAGHVANIGLMSVGPNTNSNAGEMLYGPVNTDVTAIAIRLPGGVVLNLKPVRYRGVRWVAVVIPTDVPIIRAIAYSGDRERGYAVPFQHQVLTIWLRPGQPGPARITKSLGSGVVDGISWHVTAEIGPWGYGYVYSHGNNVCIDTTADPQRVSAAKPVRLLDVTSLGANPHSGPSEGEAGVATNVRRVKLIYSDGSSASFTAVAVGSDRVVAYSVPVHASVVSSVEYGAAGQVVATPRASLWNPPTGKA